MYKQLFATSYIIVGAMGTIYKDYTDKPLADPNLDHHKQG